MTINELSTSHREIPTVAWDARSAEVDDRDMSRFRSSPYAPDSGGTTNTRQNDAVGEFCPIPDVDPNLMRAVARSRPRTNSTAPPPEQVELVADLVSLSREIVEHNRQVMAGEPTADWAAVADQLDSAARACRSLAVVELHDVDDTGRR
jgi:hypothetical protein